jgi:Calcineurin-like phosphoesterase
MVSEDLWVIGDPQGFLTRLRGILTRIGLVDPPGNWTGGKATLAILGDLVDRGLDGIGVIELVMGLQQKARRVGGRVDVLLGNHDIFLLAAHRFPQLLAHWQTIGGMLTDLDRLTREHVEWLCDLPAMLLHDDVLLVHADALLYLEYGRSLETVNAAFRQVLHGDDFAAWTRYFDEFSEHRAFSGEGGCAKLDEFLNTYGGRQLIHGHTPIARMRHVPPETVSEAYVYCEGRCVNVDPGLYLSPAAPGFAYVRRSGDTRR